MEKDDMKEAAIKRLVTELGIKEEQATWLIEDAVVLVLDYTCRDLMLEAMWIYARQIATIAYNRQGTEGETSRSEGGVSQSFNEDIPLNIQRNLNRYRLGKVVKFYAPKEE